MTELFHKYATKQQLTRQVKATDLQVERRNKLHYRVKSQSEDLWYDIIHKKDSHLEGQWTCNCLDYIFRQITCKHLYAVTLWKQHQKDVVIQDVLPPILPINNEVSNCLNCKSESIIKCGFRHNKSGDIQRYRCKECNYKFIVNIVSEIVLNMLLSVI